MKAVDFHQLWPFTQNKRIEKHRYQLQQGPWIIEVDVFKGRLEGLILAEIEFPSLQAANDFTPPEWFGSEVTKLPIFKNKNLALLKDLKSLNHYS